MAVSFLYEEYKKDPKRIEKLLDSNIEISEKLDGSRFFVQANEEGDLSYFKRKDAPITRIDRTLSKYYERAISHFETLSIEKISRLPEGWRFGMEYFPNLQPVTISYDRLPLNNLVLTDIQVRDSRDRITNVISDKETLKRWANVLEVEEPPIFFEGTLSSVQKRKILDFLNTPYQDLVTRFKTENFTYFILNLLNPEMKVSFMNNDTSKDIDGLIFKFDGKEAYRVSNPEVVLRKTSKKEEKPSDVYNLTLVILQEFVLSLDFKKIKLKEKTFEERYIEFISKVFNLFVLSPMYRENFENGVDFDLPTFLTREESRVNFRFVKDPETNKLLQKSSTNRELFKILLASMRSHKKKPSGFFTKELIYHHNDLVDKIADFINNEIAESSFYTFDEFKSIFLLESENWPQEFGKESLDEIESIDSVPPSVELISETSNFPTFDHVSKSTYLDSVEKPIKTLKKMFKPEGTMAGKGKTKVCIVKGKFCPYHNGHEVMIEDASVESGLPVLLAVNSNNAKYKLNDKLHKSIIEEATRDNKNVIGFIFVNGNSLSEIAKELPDNLEIGAYSGSENECREAKIQLGKDLQTFPMATHLSSGFLIDKIKNDDNKSFRKLTPKSIHNYYYELKNDISSQ